MMNFAGLLVFFIRLRFFSYHFTATHIWLKWPADNQVGRSRTGNSGSYTAASHFRSHPETFLVCSQHMPATNEARNDRVCVEPAVAQRGSARRLVVSELRQPQLQEPDSLQQMPSPLPPPAPIPKTAQLVDLLSPQDL